MAHFASARPRHAYRVSVILLLLCSLLLATAASASIYVPPLPDPVVVRPFEPPESRWGPGHRGVDLAGYPDAPLAAPADGVVAFSGTVVDRGVIVIDHPDGLRSTLEPVSPLVEAGQAVRRGEVVATLDSDGSHCAPHACVHWGLRRGDLYVDPWPLIDPVPRPIRLLPLCGNSRTRC